MLFRLFIWVFTLCHLVFSLTIKKPVLNNDEIDLFDMNIAKCNGEAKSIINEDIKIFKSADKLDIYDLNYTLHFIFSDNLDKYQANSAIAIRARNNISHFTFQAEGLNLKRGVLRYNGSKQNVAKFLVTYICSDSVNVYIKFNRPVFVNETITISIKFEGKPSSGIPGIYYSNYISFVNPNITEKIVSTYFQAEYAHRSFPCIDYPAVKASFYFIVEYPEGYCATSNMPQRLTKPIPGNRLITVFHRTPEMSTYLFAFTINKYDSHTEYVDKSNRTKIGIWLPKGLIEQGKASFIIAKKAILLYEKTFNINYSLPKIDLIGIPSFALGPMENWGMITFTLDYLIYNAKGAMQKWKQTVAETVVHELAHQWFGNLVTMRWWNDIWMNEGFATFMQHYILGMIYPEWRMMDQLILREAPLAMSYDEQITTHSISMPLENVTNPEVLFDVISYQKAALVINMIKDHIGEKKFFSIIEKYLNKYAYGSATSAQLWEMFSEEKIGDMINSWVYHPGFPFVAVSIMKDPGVMIITQGRYYVPQIGIFKEPFYWTIPIVSQVLFKSKETPELSNITLSNYSVSIQQREEESWIKVNHNGIGFYKVYYDKKSFANIFAAINTADSKISEIDRCNLMQDYFSFMKIMLTGFDEVMNLLDIPHSYEYFTMMEVISQYSEIATIIRYREDIYNDYKSKVKEKIQNLYNEIMKQPSGNLNLIFEITLKAKITLACVEFNCFSVVNEQLELFNAWHAGKKVVTPDYLKPMLKAAAIYGEKTSWDKLLMLYTSTRDSLLKRILLDSIPNINSQEYLLKILEHCFQAQYFSLSDAMHLMGLISQQPQVSNVLWDFVEERWEDIVAMYSGTGSNIGYYVLALAKTIDTDEQLDKFLKFFNDKHHEISIQDYLASVKIAKTQIDWFKHYLPTVKAYVKPT